MAAEMAVSPDKKKGLVLNPPRYTWDDREEERKECVCTVGNMKRRRKKINERETG